MRIVCLRTYLGKNKDQCDLTYFRRLKASGTAAGAQSEQLKTFEETSAYAIGQSMGRYIATTLERQKNLGITLTNDMILKGVQDGLVKKSLLDDKQLEKALKVAREGIDEFLVANDPTEFGCACDLSVGYLCGPCHADMQQQPLKIALAKINEVLKP